MADGDTDVRKHGFRVIASFIKAACFSLALLVAGARAQDSPAVVLEKCCALSARDLATLNKGQALGRLIKLGDDDDIAIMGAIRLTVSKEAYVDWYRRVEHFKFSPMVKEAVPFHVPPQPEDVAAVALDANQVKLLRDCRLGKCGVKLNAAEIARTRAEVDWEGANAAAQAGALAKSILLEHVAAYMQNGDSALPKFHDKAEEMDARATFRSLLESSPYVKAAFPELFARLADYRGNGEKADKNEIIYWSRELYGFGLKPLINVTHTTIYPASPAVMVIAAKQIWASHYYDGSLGITVLVDANPGTYLVYMNRSRVDLLRGAGFKKWMVRKFAPGSIRKEVIGLKKQVEASRPANAVAQ